MLLMIVNIKSFFEKKKKDFEDRRNQLKEEREAKKNGTISVPTEKVVTEKTASTAKDNTVTPTKSDAEIEKMVQEAEANKEADAKKKAVIEVRNQADALLHSTKKTLEENENAVSEDEKKAIIDAGDAFAPGQVYVALSRCTQLDSLVLLTAIRAQNRYKYYLLYLPYVYYFVKYSF